VRDDLPAFQNDDVQILAVSVDHPYALRAWADTRSYRFPLLADFWPHGRVAQEYGVFHDTAGFALRGTFLVDRSGVVRFAEVNGPGEPRDQGAWRTALAAV
jgi:peroxiredoxin